MASKPQKLLIAPKWLLVGLVTQTDWIDVITVFFIIIFKINKIICVLFWRYVSPRKSHRNGFIFKIFVWISVFRRKKRFENLILGYRDIKRTRSLIFFGIPCICCEIWKIPMVNTNIPIPIWKKWLPKDIEVQRFKFYMWKLRV